jgi:hypothetical protein
MRISISGEFILAHLSRSRAQQGKVFQSFEDVEDDLTLRFPCFLVVESLIVFVMPANPTAISYEIEIRVSRHLDGKTFQMLNAFDPRAIPKGHQEQRSWRATVRDPYGVAAAFLRKGLDQNRALQVVPVSCSIDAADTRRFDSVPHDFTEGSKPWKTAIEKGERIHQSSPTVQLLAASFVSFPILIQLTPRVTAA